MNPRETQSEPQGRVEDVWSRLELREPNRRHMELIE